MFPAVEVDCADVGFAAMNPEPRCAALDTDPAGEGGPVDGRDPSGVVLGFDHPDVDDGCGIAVSFVEISRDCGICGVV